MNLTPRQQLLNRLSQLHSLAVQNMNTYNEWNQVITQISKLQNTPIPAQLSYGRLLATVLEVIISLIKAYLPIITIFGSLYIFGWVMPMSIANNKSELEIIGFIDNPAFWTTVSVVTIALLVILYFSNKANNEKIKKQAELIKINTARQIASLAQQKQELEIKSNLTQKQIYALLSDDFYPQTKVHPNIISEVIRYIQDHRANSITEALNLYEFENRQRARDKRQEQHNQAVLRNQQAALRQQRQAHQEQLASDQFNRWMIEDTINRNLRNY